MAAPRPLVLPRRVPPRHRGHALIETVPNLGQIPTYFADLALYGFAPKVYLSFDPPSTPLPTWVDVTPFVDLARAPVRIARGRTDGLSDINPATCALTFKNNDLRFTPKNSNSPWNGLFHKGTWVRVDVIPPSGNASTRYVGFVNTVKLGSDGLDAWAQVTATDRIGSLQNARNYISMIAGEVLFDSVYQAPSGQVTLQAYYPLHEDQSAASAGDRSGNTTAVLTQNTFGGLVNGTGLAFSNTPAPGFDGLQAPSFSPPSASAGTVLQTTVATMAQAGTTSFAIELWLKTTLAGGGAFLSLTDYTTNPYVLQLGLDPSGYLAIGSAPPTPNGTVADGGNGAGNALVINPAEATLAPPPVLNDGAWHHIYVWLHQVSPTFVGFLIAIDGRPVDGPPILRSFSVPTTLNTLHIGGALSWVSFGKFYAFAGAISDLAYYTTGVNFYGLPTNMPNFVQHAQAGTAVVGPLGGPAGFAGERTDQRITRLARYAGVPQPISSALVVAASTGDPISVWTNQSAVTGPWANTQPGGHQVGVQAIAGNGPLSAMRNAAHAENMPVYTDRGGNLAFFPNTSRYNLAAAWTVAAPDLEAGSTFTDDTTYLFNEADITPEGMAAQTVTNPASQAAIGGVYSTAVSAPSVSTYDAYSLGADIVARQGDPAPRPDQIVLIANTLAKQLNAATPGSGTTWYDAVLASDVSTPFQVTSQPAWAPDAAAGVQLIEGYTEEIALGTHTFTHTTSYADAPYFTADDATLGVLDAGNVIGY